MTVMEREKELAAKAGRMAARTGRPLTVCPYDVGGDGRQRVLALAFVRGWREIGGNKITADVTKAVDLHNPDQPPDDSGTWVWVQDELIKYEAWWPRDARGRWVKRSHLTAAIKAGKSITEALREDEERRAAAARGERTDDHFRARVTAPVGSKARERQAATVRSEHARNVGAAAAELQEIAHAGADREQLQARMDNIIRRVDTGAADPETLAALAAIRGDLDSVGSADELRTVLGRHMDRHRVELVGAPGEDTAFDLDVHQLQFGEPTPGRPVFVMRQGVRDRESGKLLERPLVATADEPTAAPPDPGELVAPPGLRGWRLDAENRRRAADGLPPLKAAPLPPAEPEPLILAPKAISTLAAVAAGHRAEGFDEGFARSLSRTGELKARRTGGYPDYEFEITEKGRHALATAIPNTEPPPAAPPLPELKSPGKPIRSDPKDLLVIKPWRHPKTGKTRYYVNNWPGEKDNPGAKVWIERGQVHTRGVGEDDLQMLEELLEGIHGVKPVYKMADPEPGSGPWSESPEESITAVDTILKAWAADRVKAVESDGAGGADPKAAAPPPDLRWPGWTQDLAIAAAAAPAILAALRAGLTITALRALADKFLRWVSTRPPGSPPITPQTPGRGRRRPPPEARNWLTTDTDLGPRIEQAITGPIQDVWAQGYMVGHRAADAVLTELAGGGDPRHAVEISVDWGNWQPGHPDAARRIMTADGSIAPFEMLLDDFGINISRIAANRLDEVAAVLADGLEQGRTPDEIAEALTGVLNDRRWAHMVAVTETNRAMSAASMDSYQAADIAATSWMTALDQRVCPICFANEFMPDGVTVRVVPIGQRYPSGDLHPPGHPHCRCALVPALVELVKAWTVAGRVYISRLQPITDILTRAGTP